MRKIGSPGSAKLTTINTAAAAVDIGSKMHVTAVDPARSNNPVRSFGSFTRDLHDLADWFQSCGATSVAMELTGVYWIPAYEILEQHGFEVVLVNARYAKNVPGRKTDVSDASWLRQLHPRPLARQFPPRGKDRDVAPLPAPARTVDRICSVSGPHVPLRCWVDFGRRAAGGESIGGVGFGPCPRNEFVDARGGPKIDEPVEDVGDIGLRLDIVELASFNGEAMQAQFSAPSS